jgi:hypothetical protein
VSDVHVRYTNLNEWLSTCERLNLKITEFGSTGFVAHKKDPWLTLVGTWCGELGYIKEEK